MESFRLKRKDTRNNSNPLKEIKTTGKGNYIGEYKVYYYLYFLLLFDVKDNCVKQKIHTKLFDGLII